MPEKVCRIDIDREIATVRIPGDAGIQCRDFLGILHRQFLALADKKNVKGIMIAPYGGHFCQTAPSVFKNPSEAAALSGYGQQVMFSLESSGIPTIAALTGEVTGVGLELALASSFIYASKSASFGFTGIENGMLPAFGGSQRLSRQVGKSGAKMMLFSGEPISAQEALRLRLASRLFDEPELEPSTLQMLTRIAANSPLAVRVGAEIIDAGYDIDMRTACLLERDAFALCFATDDQKEGMGAFMEKRKPHFRGE